MDKHFGWWVDLAKVTLSDTSGGATAWVHALPFGSYQHPLYGKMDFDASKLGALASSVKTRVRGIDPDIDYDHKADPVKGNLAAGWVKDAKVDNAGLHLQVDFTPAAAKSIKDKEYRYFSAEFVDEWTDATGTAHKDVLFGGGLTNRPFMKNLLPVNLSELLSEGLPPKDNPPTEAEVDLKKLAELLGLPATSTEEQVLAKLGEMASGVVKLTEDNKKLGEEIEKLKKDPNDGLDPELMRLVEASPAFAKVLADMKEKDQKLTEMQTAMRLTEVNSQIADLQRGKTFALAPVVKEDVRNILLKSDSAAGKQLFEFLEKIMNGIGLVDLSERGHAGRRLDEVDVTRRFNDMIKQYMETNKVDYGQAVEVIARENPQMFNDYREATYQFKA
jgi:hypothetical protein